MAKVTSKLQVTIPKALAKEYGIEPGDEIEFHPAGAEIRVVPPRVEKRDMSTAERLRLFRTARARQREREATMRLAGERPTGRGWRRQDLYERGASAPDEPKSDGPEDGT